MKKIRIGIVGCGAMGSEIAGATLGLFKEKLKLTALYDTDQKKMEHLSESLGEKIAVRSLDALFDKADLVIESAGKNVSREMLKKAIETKKDVMIMSIGGLIEAGDMLREAEKKGIKVYLPSGAICGLDGLKAAKFSKIEKVTLRTQKPPKGLKGAPYLRENNIDLDSIKDEKIIFRGSAIDAVKGFPKNVNVSSVLSLAGIGSENTRVEIITSPSYTKNSHEVTIEGDFGKITTRTENVPSLKNPKTSKLAMLSAIATLKGITESVKIGT